MEPVNARLIAEPLATRKVSHVPRNPLHLKKIQASGGNKVYPMALRDEIRTWVLIQGKSQVMCQTTVIVAWILFVFFVVERHRQ
ncbi:hypothetical protein Krac_0027 [Ktedonobacter racemifer DSM 44963]|uniref:Uncharacterized protein n=1 Tax=Ktedonobacter racemifer DSM 44963 TaxID=485913 RepID=D6U8W7_KTERA|nr:hypothetical protein Krac_0027 [Ktedonobacter racemifer DSM 44963]